MRAKRAERALRWWRLTAMLLAIYTVLICAELSFWDAGRLAGAGTTGAEQAQLTVDPAAPGFVRVGAVARGSPLYRAG